MNRGPVSLSPWWLGPIQVTVQEAEGAFAVDGVRAVEEFEFGAIADSQLIVVAPDFGKFAGDQFGWLTAVTKAGLDHERSW